MISFIKLIKTNGIPSIYFKLRPLILPIDEILSFIPLNAHILDLGCGKGLLLEHIKNFKSYKGVDLNVPSDKYKDEINNSVTLILLIED